MTPETGHRRILVFGAGNIGRSFVGQVFGRNGYGVVFADVDRPLVEALRRDGRYDVVHRYPDGTEERLTITGVTAVDSSTDSSDDTGSESAALHRHLAEVDLVATSVGAAVLPRLLPQLTEEALRRAQTGEGPFDLILAENIHGAGDMVRAAFTAGFTQAERAERYDGTTPEGALPGVIECSVGKMVPIISAAQRQNEPTTVWAEGFNTLLVDADGWSGDIPDIPQLRPVRPIGAWVDRKLYIHNLGHAACAYLGHRGFTYIWEAIGDKAIHTAVRRVMDAAAEGLRREYPGVFAPADLDDHIDDLLYRFSSRSLGDTVFRVGRDLKRKLGPEDRVVGALRLLQKHGLDTTPVEEVYRAALHFRAVDESGRPFPSDREFLDTLEAADDPATFIAETSGFRLPEERSLVERLLPGR